jgi:hypothetical protein
MPGENRSGDHFLLWTRHWVLKEAVVASHSSTTEHYAANGTNLLSYGKNSANKKALRN